jgi:peroxiredoxin
VGDQAPDFSLMKQDKSGSVRLSILTAAQPVVLIFRQLHLTAFSAGGSRPQ